MLFIIGNHVFGETIHVSSGLTDHLCSYLFYLMKYFRPLFYFYFSSLLYLDFKEVDIRDVIEFKSNRLDL